MSSVVPFTRAVQKPDTAKNDFSDSQVPCNTTLEFSDGGVYKLGDQFDFHGAQEAVNQSLASTSLFQLQMILMETPEHAEWINAQLERIIRQVYK